MLGHADIQTTMIYMHEKDRIENAPNTKSPTFPSHFPPCLIDGNSLVGCGEEKKGTWCTSRSDAFRDTNSFGIFMGQLA
jgi:hypothetical protein